MNTEPGLGRFLLDHKLRYEMGDWNIVDSYLFTITFGDTVSVKYENPDGVRVLKFAQSAFDGATTNIVLMQGVARSSTYDQLPDVIESDLPPFFVSRAVLTQLQRIGSAEIKPEWSEKRTRLFARGREDAYVVVNGRQQLVPTILCVGGEDFGADDRLPGKPDECRIWVIEDRRWPLVIRREEGFVSRVDAYGGNFWRLLEAGHTLEPAD